MASALILSLCPAATCITDVLIISIMSCSSSVAGIYALSLDDKGTYAAPSTGIARPEGVGPHRRSAL